MGKKTQAGHTPTPSENSKNRNGTGTDRASRVGIHRKSAIKKTRSGILNNFKGSMPAVGAVIRTKDENFKESFQNLKAIVLKYLVENYKK